jgi:hypothetical protein
MTVDELVDWVRQHEDDGFWARPVQKSDPGMWVFGRNGIEGPYYAILRDEDPDRTLRIHDHLVAQFGLPPLHVAPVETPAPAGLQVELAEWVGRIIRRWR